MAWQPSHFLFPVRGVISFAVIDYGRDMIGESDVATCASGWRSIFPATAVGRCPLGSTETIDH